MKLAILSVEFLRGDVADEFFGWMAKDSTDYRNHFTHIPFTVPVHLRHTKNLCAKPWNAVFLSDWGALIKGRIFSQFAKKKKIALDYRRDRTLDDLPEDVREVTEFLHYGVEQELKQDWDIVWCHYWNLLHNVEAFQTKYHSHVNWISAMFQQTVKKYPDWTFVITADHGLLFPEQQIGGRFQRSLCREVLRVPLYVQGDKKVVDRYTHHDSFDHWINQRFGREHGPTVEEEDFQACQIWDQQESRGGSEREMSRDQLAA